MDQAVIVHGMPPRAEYDDPRAPAPQDHHWLPWLAGCFEAYGIPAWRPAMPVPYAPSYTAWSRVFEERPVTAGTVAVGHSCGAGFLVRWLAAHPNVRIARLVVVAPWLDPTGHTSPDMFREGVDPAAIASLGDRVGAIGILNSSNDHREIQVSVERLRSALPAASYVKLRRRGHFADGPGQRLSEILPLAGLPIDVSPIAPRR